jgi:putative endonuclease
MKYVYLLQSLSVPTQRYVDVTTNLEERLQAHNAGASLYTSKYRPWKVVMYLCFQDDRRAVDFERYLKTGSGQAFANKRLCRFCGLNLARFGHCVKARQGSQGQRLFLDH